MVELPEPLNPTVQAIYESYERRADDGYREHLGASLIASACDRAKWYTFRWTTKKEFQGRILRLFRRGETAEACFIEELRDVGVQVIAFDPETGRQFRLRDETGHFGGSPDGVAIGFREAPKAWHVCEFKTHNAKSFKALKDKGVKESKPAHWGQMQTYMHLMKIDRAFYLAENKDTSELYQERIYADHAEGLRIVARAKRIIDAAEPLAGVSTDPAWHECRFCDHHEACHGTLGQRRLPERHCRSCLHATPVSSGENAGKWHCAKHGWWLNMKMQKSGCGSGHRYIPALVSGRQTDVAPDGAWIEYEMPDGSMWRDEGKRA